MPALEIKTATLEKVGLTVNGQLIERLLHSPLRNPVSLEDSAQALLEIFGADSRKVMQKSPLILWIRRESLVQRLKVLASLLGEKEALTAVVATPLILLARQETIKESYDKFEERFLVEMMSCPCSTGTHCCWASPGNRWALSGSTLWRKWVRTKARSWRALQR